MRQGVKSGVGRLERMKRGSGIKDREDKSSSIEIPRHSFQNCLLSYESIKREL